MVLGQPMPGCLTMQLELVQHLFQMVFALQLSEIQFTDDTINTPNINVAQNLNISGTSTLGIASASQLYVSGLSTFAGIRWYYH
jgi:hypothetical protein